MSRTQYYTATTLDGFIATPDNSPTGCSPASRTRRAR